MDKIIIGSVERAGLPISAPKGDIDKIKNAPGLAQNIRWIKDDQHFRLVVKEDGSWVEVPCLVPTYEL